MNNEIRDREFAKAVNEITNTIQWPDASFSLSPWETVLGLFGAFFEATTTPNRVILRFALNGIAL